VQLQHRAKYSVASAAAKLDALLILVRSSFLMSHDARMRLQQGDSVLFLLHTFQSFCIQLLV